MPRPANPHPTDGELEILQILWNEGPSPLSKICGQLRRSRQVATTTVATMLRIMLDKRLVSRKKTARGYMWQPVVTRDKAAKGMVAKLVENVFDGSAHRLATHLVEAGGLDDEQLKSLQKLIRQHRDSK